MSIDPELVPIIVAITGFCTFFMCRTYVVNDFETRRSYVLFAMCLLVFIFLNVVLIKLFLGNLTYSDEYGSSILKEDVVSDFIYGVIFLHFVYIFSAAAGAKSGFSKKLSKMNANYENDKIND